MIKEGQVVLFRFPHTDQTGGKLRPALAIRRLPGPHKDWLVCMISSKLSQKLSELDEIIADKDADFKQSGLKQDSLIRIARLAMVQGSNHALEVALSTDIPFWPQLPLYSYYEDI